MMQPKEFDVVLLKDGRQAAVLIAEEGVDAVYVEDVDAEMRGEDFDNCLFIVKLEDIEKITWVYAEHNPKAAAELKHLTREYEELEQGRERCKSQQGTE